MDHLSNALAYVGGLLEELREIAVPDPTAPLVQAKIMRLEKIEDFLHAASGEHNAVERARGAYEKRIRYAVDLINEAMRFDRDPGTLRLGHLHQVLVGNATVQDAPQPPAPPRNEHDLRPDPPPLFVLIVEELAPHPTWSRLRYQIVRAWTAADAIVQVERNNRGYKVTGCSTYAGPATEGSSGPVKDLEDHGWKGDPHAT